jgi:acyl-CoA thioesterase I
MQKIVLPALFVCFTFCTGSMNPVESKSISYLALGDSYTIGEGVAVKDCWPNQLADKLRETGVSVTAPKIIARTGWRTDNLMAAIEAENLTEKYDLVSVLIGVNNQFQGKSMEVYKKDLRELFNTAINQCSRGKSGVFVLSIPDYGSTPFGKIEREAIGQEIDTWNLACKSICDEFEISFYDITVLSKRAVEDASLTTKDNLHPSGKMYALWVEEIYGKVAALVK